jgi:hypothetical protein
MHLAPAKKRENRLRAVAGLHFGHREIDAACIQPWRRSRLQPPHRQFHLAQAAGKRGRRRIAGSPGGIALEADMDQAGEESAGGEDNRAGVEAHPELRHYTGDAIAFEQDVVNSRLEERQAGLVFEALADRLAIQRAVRLSPRRTYGGPFGQIQRAELDPGFVRGERHRAAQGVEFLDEVTLANAAD